MTIDESQIDDMQPQLDEVGQAFQSGLAESMQAAARSWQARVVAAAAYEEIVRVDALQAASERDAERIRVAAAAEEQRIRGWTAEAIKRVEAQREERIYAVRERLVRDLDRHRVATEHRMTEVRSSMADYLAALDAVVASIEGETDPLAIARHAVSLPLVASLEARPAETVTDTSLPATPEGDGSVPRLVGVMDESAVGRTAEASDQLGGTLSPVDTAGHVSPSGEGGPASGGTFDTTVVGRPLMSRLAHADASAREPGTEP
jgi:hypothetical protein